MNQEQYAAMGYAPHSGRGGETATKGDFFYSVGAQKRAGQRSFDAHTRRLLLRQTSLPAAAPRCPLVPGLHFLILPPLLLGDRARFSSALAVVSSAASVAATASSRALA